MSLFPEPDDPPPPLAARLAPKLKSLAERGICFGTSSWKYEGWLGSIYGEARYKTRNKFSKKKFEDSCLAEYARTFPAVCGDFAFYQFPGAELLARLFEATPPAFLFGLKVPEDITVATWPRHARYGQRAGQENEHFLDAKVFARHFAKLLEPHRDRLGPLIFEFGTFNKSTFPDAVVFMTRLESFLVALPEGLPLRRRAQEPRIPVACLFRDARRPQRGPRLQRLDANAHAGRSGAVAGGVHGGFHRGSCPAAEGAELRGRGEEIRAISGDPGTRREFEGRDEGDRQAVAGARRGVPSSS